VQLTHDPLLAQAFAAVPGAQLPPLQQPPLHGWLASQPVVRQTLSVLQALPLAQSVAAVQPPLVLGEPDPQPKSASAKSRESEFRSVRLRVSSEDHPEMRWSGLQVSASMVRPL
jgi:hypothetical protein